MDSPRVTIDESLCLGCGICQDACGRKLIEPSGESYRVARPQACSQCGHCKAVCPVDAPVLAGVDAAEFRAAPRQFPDPEDLLAFMRSRRSIRLFRDRPVEREKVELLIQAGRYAPTGQNRQALAYVVLRRPDVIAEVRRLSVAALLEQGRRLEREMAAAQAGGPPLADDDQPWRDYPPAFRLMAELVAQGHDPLFHHAPVVVAVHVHPHQAMHAEVEAGMAAMQMGLMAVSLGLGTCYCGLLDYAARHDAELRRELELPDGHQVPVAFMLGYPELEYPRLVARRPAQATWL